MGRFLVRSEPPSAADVVVVLGGDHSGNRVLKGGELVRQGFAPVVLVSGGSSMYGRAESDLAIAFAVARGYPEKCFRALRDDVLSTREEARADLQELRKWKVHRVLLVTSDFHTRRAGNVFRSLGPDFEIHVVSAPDKYFRADRWWWNRESQKEFLKEWLKTVANWFGV